MKRTAAAVLMTLALCAAAAAQSGETQSKPARARKGAAGAAQMPAAGVDEVERLLDRFMLAQGGVAFFAIRTRITRGRVEMSDSHLSGTFETYAKRPHKVMLVANTPRGQLIEASDEGRRWVQTPWGGMTAAAGGADEIMARAGSGKGGFKWRSAFSSASLKGRVLVEGRPMDVLAATPHGRSSLLMYFDAATGLLGRMEFPLPEGAEAGQHLKAVIYDSYATVDGVKVPVGFRQVYTNFTLTFIVTEVKHDVPIEDALFESPKGV